MSYGGSGGIVRVGVVAFEITADITLVAVEGDAAVALV